VACDSSMVGGDRKGVGGMTKFGVWPSNAVTPIGEAYFQVTVNMGLTVAGENIFTMGSFAMPFAGSLQAELYAEVHWPNGTSPDVFLSVGAMSTPAPSGSGDLGVCQPGAVGYNSDHDMRTHAVWNGLSAGAVVTGVARIWTNLANTVTLSYLGGFWRPMAS
jgi:hypothetical protein